MKRLTKARIDRLRTLLANVKREGMALADELDPKRTALADDDTGILRSLEACYRHASAGLTLIDVHEKQLADRKDPGNG